MSQLICSRPKNVNTVHQNIDKEKNNSSLMCKTMKPLFGKKKTENQNQPTKIWFELGNKVITSNEHLNCDKTTAFMSFTTFMNWTTDNEID